MLMAAAFEAVGSNAVASYTIYINSMDLVIYILIFPLLLADIQIRDSMKDIPRTSH